MALKQVYTPGKRALPSMNSKASNTVVSSKTPKNEDEMMLDSLTEVVKKESSKPKKPSSTVPKVKLTPKTAKGSGSTKSFYVSNENYDKLKALANANNMNMSEVLNEVLSQVL